MTDLENTTDAYLKERGFEVMDGKPQRGEQRPYVEIRTAEGRPGSYEVWLGAGVFFGYRERFNKRIPVDVTAGAVADFVSETAQKKCDIPRGRRLKVFATPECRELALFLPEMYGGIL